MSSPIPVRIMKKILFRDIYERMACQFLPMLVNSIKKLLGLLGDTLATKRSSVVVRLTTGIRVLNSCHKRDT